MRNNPIRFTHKNVLRLLPKTKIDYDQEVSHM